MNDLCIRGALVATGQGAASCAVNVAGGQVVSVGAAQAARKVIDATGKLLLPGLIDLHVHFSEPGRDWEGWVTGSRSAAAGGVTTVVDMPLNAVPATTDAAALQLKLGAAQASCVDYALWGGLVRDNRADLPQLLSGGVVGLKAFMYETGDPTFPPAPDGILYTGMQALARAGLPLSVHAENSELIHTLVSDLQAAGDDGPSAWLAAHPAISEVEAVARALRFARETGCRLHVVHVSLPEAAKLIIEAKKAGQDVSFEVCTHHLTLNADDFRRLGAVAKCAPPLREQAEVNGLWALLLSGEIDTLASDHSPCPVAAKDTATLWEAWGGINALQLTAPLLLTEGRRRGVCLEQLAQVLAWHGAQRPAEVARLPGKGCLAPGYDADMVLIDPLRRWTLQAGDLKTRHPWSPFVGREFVGAVERVWLRGQALYQGGEVQAGVRGQLLRPGQVAPGAYSLLP